MRFLNAEIGKDTDRIFEYLRNVPKIDMIYNAPPNPGSIKVWYKMAQNNNYIEYNRFLDNLFEIYKYIAPKTIAVEVLENREIVLSRLNEWGFYKKTEIFPITYTAPLRFNKPGMSYCRKPNGIVVCTNDKYLDLNFEFTYSHDFLNNFFIHNSSYTSSFDPCIGKGLLIRYCANTYGIEMNTDRFNEAVATHDLYWNTQQSTNN